MTSDFLDDSGLSEAHQGVLIDLLPGQLDFSEVPRIALVNRVWIPLCCGGHRCEIAEKRMKRARKDYIVDHIEDSSEAS